MTTDRFTVIQARGELTAVAARTLAQLAKRQSRSLARIARAHEEYVGGRITGDRLIEVVRRETELVGRPTRQATRRSGPVRG